jgi:hypothetical protein
MDEISECVGVLIRIRRIGIEKAVAVSTAFRIGPLYISRLFHGALSHLDFICRYRHIIGTVPVLSNGSGESIKINRRS